ncbi:MAG: hypothetical protein ABR528_06365, partial [Pseudonocardiaceae bacterium]
MKLLLRWALVTALLAGALAVALWPRATPATAPWSTGATQAAAGQPNIDQPNIDQLRSRAALQPCPSAPAGIGEGRGPLSG